MSNKVETYLTAKKNSSPPELSKKFGDLEELYNKKLWHQVTLSLLELVKEPTMKEGTELISLYNNITSELENKINPLSLAEMAGEVMTQYKDPNEAITFIERVSPKVVDHQEARVLCNVLKAQATLKRLEDPARTKKILDDTEKLLDDIDGITPVHAKFYKLASDLYCHTGAHALYYRAALRYLGCTELSELDDDSKGKHAFYLGLAALLGEGIYNFGELLAHPILGSLEGCGCGWLLELLITFNQGDINKFESSKQKWSSQPDLLARETHLREKIRLLCLMEMTLQRKAWDRQLSFSEIATATGLGERQVEVMVMRALALGLVKGTIDQVSRQVNITWVQPRVLHKNQLVSMMERLSDWCEDVSSMQTLLQDQAASILTH
ncbi:hypothetical protein Pmani_032638 [Petrolisthes manimaculis]|uniref:26S proteasome non-ATPase regulatory subunit 13 n=1 Tax=Petrolisthes manimaculis TaxID=1843537 RepID=A0AAE1TTK9_9EUCA|nr:hypothetical protein Pmani_032638 [Petrolisthes manimaculis]